MVAYEFVGRINGQIGPIRNEGSPYRACPLSSGKNSIRPDLFAWSIEGNHAMHLAEFADLIPDAVSEVGVILRWLLSSNPSRYHRSPGLVPAISKGRYRE